METKTRDPERIKSILNLLEEIWNSNPDQRFGQLLINLGLFPDSIGNWRIEDDEIENNLKSKKREL